MTSRSIGLAILHTSRHSPTRADRRNGDAMNKLDVVWREFRLWDARAIRADVRLRHARQGALVCALAGAALGAIAGQIGLSEPTPAASTLAERLGILSALLVGMASWIGRELLYP